MFHDFIHLHIAIAIQRNRVSNITEVDMHNMHPSPTVIALKQPCFHVENNVLCMEYLNNSMTGLLLLHGYSVKVSIAFYQTY